VDAAAELIYEHGVKGTNTNVRLVRVSRRAEFDCDRN
jgi:hypothetical protein